MKSRHDTPKGKQFIPNVHNHINETGNCWCNFCGEYVKKIAMHLKKHDINPGEYYDEYMDPDGMRKCAYCNEPTGITSYVDREYAMFCDSDCYKKGNQKLKAAREFGNKLRLTREVRTK